MNYESPSNINCNNSFVIDLYLYFVVAIFNNNGNSLLLLKEMEHLPKTLPFYLEKTITFCGNLTKGDLLLLINFITIF